MPILPPNYHVGSLVDLPEVTAHQQAPPTPTVAPADYCLVVARYGVIEQLSDHCTITEANALRHRIIEANDGQDISIVTLKKEVAAMLRVGQKFQAVLDALELHAARSRPT